MRLGSPLEWSVLAGAVVLCLWTLAAKAHPAHWVLSMVALMVTAIPAGDA